MSRLAASTAFATFRHWLACCLLLMSAALPLSAWAIDTDGDGVDDSIDAFPTDSCAITDTDNDGKPDRLYCYKKNWSQSNGSLTDFWSLDVVLLAPQLLTYTPVSCPSGHGCAFPSYPSNTVLPAGTYHLEWRVGPGCAGGPCISPVSLNVTLGSTTLVEDTDHDNDGTDDISDNCPLISNANQRDSDGDGAGDVCDASPYTTYKATKLVAGSYYSCALTTTGQVKCWGDNRGGQLGNNTTNNSPAPVDVMGLGNDITAIAAGGSHTCALTAAGAVKCWGMNSRGQLGNNTTAWSSTPVDVSGLGSGVKAIVAGDDSTCAVMVSGAVKCWGGNYYGQLGNNTTNNSLVPVDVVGLGSGVKAVAAGYTHTCAVMEAGVVKCWGDDSYGELGVSASSLIPVDVSSLNSGVTAIAAGNHFTCALTSAGAVKCWGRNAFGQLGNNTAVDSSSPVDVNGLVSGVAAITTGGEHACAVSATGELQCWGYNTYGQLGDNTTIQRNIPVGVIGMDSGVAEVAGGYKHTCALSATGSVKCWGYNFYGQLGDNTSIRHTAPGYVVGFADDTDSDGVIDSLDNCVSVSNVDQLNTDGDGTGDACDNDNDNDGTSDVAETALGNNPLNNLDPPMVLINAEPVLAGADLIVGLDNHTAGASVFTTSWSSVSGTLFGDGLCANCVAPNINATMTAGGDLCGVNTKGVFCLWWGMDSGTVHGDELLPIQVAGQTYNPLHDWDGYLKYVDQSSVLHNVATDAFKISGDHHTHACIVSKTLGVYCWASHSGSDIVSSNIPAALQNISTVKDVAVGASHACAINNAAVQCWGDATSGKTTVLGAVNAPTQIAAGADHTCVINANGTVSCWGDNSNGQLGDFDMDGLVDGVSSALNIAAGSNHTCAVTGTYSTPSSLRVQCWGKNNIGQTSVPTSFTNGVDKPVNVTAAGNQTCATKAGQNVAASALVCWPVGLVP